MRRSPSRTPPAITLLLEPFGTDRYDGPWRTIKIIGYGFCIALPFLALHGLVYAWRGGRWSLYNEVLSRTLLLGAIFTCCWYYNVRVINDAEPSWRHWVDYVVYIALPHAAVLAPLLVLLAMLLISKYPEPAPGTRRPLVIRGRNRGEVLRPRPDEFVFAEAQPIYVSICRRTDGSMDRVLIRAPLTDVARQVPGAIRIHRSFLVNPAYVAQVQGNARKREVVLTGLERRLPVSTGFDVNALRR